MIEIAIIAPVRAYRDALADALASDSEIRVVARGTSVVDAVASIGPRHPAVTLIDFAVAELVKVLSALHRASPRTLIVGFGIETRRDHSELVVRAAEVGLSGFIDADQPLMDIVQAVRLALRGESPCSPRIAALLLAAMQRHSEPPRSPGVPPPASALTPRESVVAELVCLGLTNRQIASRLVVGESTVKTHVHSILAKLGVAERGEIVISTGSPESAQRR
jgi:two-component system, NarL family, nitrate/nitrite response regulator NarL